MVRSSFLVLGIVLFTTTLAWSQKDRYMVFFKDKNDTPYTLDTPDAFLSPLAIQRRIRNDVPLTQDDLPVNPGYVQQVSNTGAEVFFRTRWMNGVLVQCEPTLIAALTELPFVARVELVAPKAKLIPNGRRKVAERRQSVRSSEVTGTQLKMIGLDRMHDDDKRGDGIIIAILDSGFEGVDIASPFAHIFNEDRIDLTVSRDFVYNSGNVFQHDDHGTEVFSVIAAYQQGTFTGGAYKATYQLYVTEEVPTEYRVEEYNWLFAAEQADSAGADIIQSSLGYYDFDLSSMDYQKSQMDGRTTVVSRAAQWAADRGIVVVVSAGNEGNVSWQIITAPADAQDVLAVANVNADLVRASSSSKGPTADHRIKPDVAALGTGTSVIQKTGSTGKSSGTSLAAPLITSLAAGVLQRYPSLTSKEVRDAIRYSASQAANPDYLTGYGIPHYVAVVNYLEQVLQQNDFDIFPNPFGPIHDSLTIRPRDPSLVTNCTIELLSAEGKRLLQVQPEFSWLNNVYSPNLEHLSTGLYFLRISSNGKKYTYKLIRK
jgi:serine protease AprX